MGRLERLAMFYTVHSADLALSNIRFERRFDITCIFECWVMLANSAQSRSGLRVGLSF